MSNQTSVKICAADPYFSSKDIKSERENYLPFIQAVLNSHMRCCVQMYATFQRR